MQTNNEFSQCRNEANFGEARFKCKLPKDKRNGNKGARCSCKNSRRNRNDYQINLYTDSVLECNRSDWKFESGRWLTTWLSPLGLGWNITVVILKQTTNVSDWMILNQMRHSWVSLRSKFSKFFFSVLTFLRHHNVRTIVGTLTFIRTSNTSQKCWEFQQKFLISKFLVF